LTKESSTGLTEAEIEELRVAMSYLQTHDTSMPVSTVRLCVGSIFSVDWNKLFMEHNWATPLTVVVDESLETLVSLVNRCRGTYPKDGKNIERWRLDVETLLAGLTVGLDRWESPVSVPVKGDLRVYDKNGDPILCVYRQAYPSVLHDYLNKLMTEIYEEEESTWNFSKTQQNREEGHRCEVRHYGVRTDTYIPTDERDQGKKNTLTLYAEGWRELHRVKRSLPHWHFVEKFLARNEPSVVAALEKVNQHQIRVGGTITTGLALTFDPSDPHSDIGDCAAGLLTYLHGPHTTRWLSGAFLVRMIGLRIPVRPSDLILFVSRLWHAVDHATGVRCSAVSYTKPVGAVKDKGTHVAVPDNMKWMLCPDFGLADIPIESPVTCLLGSY